MVDIEEYSLVISLEIESPRWSISVEISSAVFWEVPSRIIALVRSASPGSSLGSFFDPECTNIVVPTVKESSFSNTKSWRPFSKLEYVGVGGVNSGKLGISGSFDLSKLVETSFKLFSGMTNILT